jgi:hypothetical protein
MPSTQGTGNEGGAANAGGELYDFLAKFCSTRGCLSEGLLQDTVTLLARYRVTTVEELQAVFERYKTLPEEIGRQQMESYMEKAGKAAPEGSGMDELVGAEIGNRLYQIFRCIQLSAAGPRVTNNRLSGASTRSAF